MSELDEKIEAEFASKLDSKVNEMMAQFDQSFFKDGEGYLPMNSIQAEEMIRCAMAWGSHFYQKENEAYDLAVADVLAEFLGECEENPGFLKKRHYAVLDRFETFGPALQALYHSELGEGTTRYQHGELKMAPGMFYATEILFQEAELLAKKKGRSLFARVLKKEKLDSEDVGIEEKIASDVLMAIGVMIFHSAENFCNNHRLVGGGGKDPS